MKKILFMFLAATMITACSKDDDSSKTDGDEPILGQWFLIDARAGSVNNTLTECQQQSSITFNEDGSAQSEYYEETEGTCNLESSEEGTWMHNSDGTYTIDAPIYGEITGTANFEGSTGFTFTSPDLAPIVLVFEK
ncbi:MAG: lipocalin family protein [Christiangramia sp.]|nr:hypothetical protein [Christiangramia sp.]|tara:strand:+ start:285 stop:692 length:408 start_codon:yes stop_codon:yes gene_type:complete